jgi:polyketide biosynthesis enoyl-CoA hydratase PksH
MGLTQDRPLLNSEYKTLKVRFDGQMGFIQLYRPDANNTINSLLIEELVQALAHCEQQATVVVVEGLPEVFCLGADFRDIHDQLEDGRREQNNAERLYRLWLQLATGPYVTIAHVRGKANAGGLGFVSACDIVVAAADVQFSLSEMLFGLFPACVMPFLVRRIGMQRAHYLTLMTKPIGATEALAWGLVDVLDQDSERALRLHLRRLRCLAKPAIAQYKKYMAELNRQLTEVMPLAVNANHQMFSNRATLDAIHRYVESGRLPWEP